jgi:hypothetical protein
MERDESYDHRCIVKRAVTSRDALPRACGLCGRGEADDPLRIVVDDDRFETSDAWLVERSALLSTVALGTFCPISLLMSSVWTSGGTIDTVGVRRASMR